MKYFFTIIFSLFVFLVTAQQNATVTMGDATGTTISRHIYGHFAEHLGRCIYDGFYRDGKIRMDIVDALKKIKVSNLRWPGGCFADQYHWMDGIGDQKKRPSRVNTNWGMVVENNSFGTEEYLQLCELLACEPYISANAGSAAPVEMQSWLEYLNYNGNTTLTALRKRKPYAVSFWGVGNESWGCGGNMTAESYADVYKRYASFCPDYPGTKLKKIASGGYGADYHWTETLMKNTLGDVSPWGISLHYYIFPGTWTNKGSATEFSEREYFVSMQKTLKLDSIIGKHSAIMDKYDPKKTIALAVDEWGIWTDVEKGTNKDFLFQQNSLRDALIAATCLNMFNNHADRVRMANLAQAINVLQSLILTQGDKMILTPTYHVFDLFKVHQDAKHIKLEIKSPFFYNGRDSIVAVNASASIDSNGVKHITMVNLDPDHETVVLLPGIVSTNIVGRILTSEKITDINSFEDPAKIKINYIKEASRDGNVLKMTLPSKSVVQLTIQ